MERRGTPFRHEARRVRRPERLSDSPQASQAEVSGRDRRGLRPLTLDLVEVTEDDPTSVQEHFSLVFRGPHDRVLSQGMCRMEHAALGVFVLFIVPVGPDARGMRYQAVFNRFRTPAGTAP